MEIMIPKKELLDTLSAAALVAPKKPSRPILSHVRLTADDGLSIEATDLEVCLSTRADCDVHKSGSVCVHAQAVLDVVKKMPDAPIRLETDDASGSIALSSDKIRFVFPTMPSDDYPELTGVDELKWIEYPANLFADLVQSTLFAVATDSTRYYLGGVFVEIPASILPNPRLTMSSTDGHRLAHADDMAPISENSLSFTLGKDPLATVLKLLGKDPADDIEIGTHGNHVAFRRENWLLTSLVIEGDFPDYRQVIPQQHTGHLITDRAQLLEALNRVSVISQEKSWGVRIAVGLPDGLVVSASNVGKGDGRQLVELAEVSGTVEIGCNAHLLTDALKALDTDLVRIEFQDSLSPLVILPVLGEGSTRGKRLHVVMPMRI